MHDQAYGDIDVSVYDEGCVNWLGGSSTNGWESVNLDNFSPTPMTFLVHVYMAGAEPCHDYTIRLRGEPGINYCTSSPKSTGLASSISGHGSASVASNGMTFVNDWDPDNSFGLFFYGPGSGNVPFGNGTRCVTQTIIRSPVQAAFKGSFLWEMIYADQASTPNPIVPGATYNFQCWFRDTPGGGAMFDLSDGYRVAFTP